MVKLRKINLWPRKIEEKRKNIVAYVNLLVQGTQYTKKEHYWLEISLLKLFSFKLDTIIVG